MPGWNNLESAKGIHAFFEIGGLILFAALVLFEILAHRHTKREDLFKILALVSFAFAVGSELCAYPYSRRVEQLSSTEFEALTLKLNETTRQLNDNSNLLVEAKAAAQQATNTLNDANIAVLQNLSRHLSNDQKQALLDVVGQYPKLKFAFMLENTVSDAKGIANDLARVFLSAGWEMEKSEGGIMPVGDGIFLRSKEENDATTKAIAATLTSFGIDTYVDEQRKFGNRPLTNMVFVVIGHKPQK